MKRVCEDCGETKGKIVNSRKFGKMLCNKCYLIYNTHGGEPKKYPLPPKGEIHYNEEGKPICHICGRAEGKILAHVWQKHKMSADEYKKKFGLDRIRGVVSDEVKEHHSKPTLENYDTVIKENLIEGGKASRFKKGSAGRTRDKVSEQTLKRLKKSGKKKEEKQ